VKRSFVIGLTLATVTAAYACGSRSPVRVPSTIDYGKRNEALECIELKGGLLTRLCTAPERRGSRIVAFVGEAYCARVRSLGACSVGYAAETDEPNRAELTLTTTANRFEFIVDATPKSHEAAPAPATGSSGSGALAAAGGSAGGAGTSQTSKAFEDLLPELDAEIRIDVFDESCDRLCERRDGKATIILANRGIEATNADYQLECNIVSFTSQARSGSAGAPSSNSTAAGGTAGPGSSGGADATAGSAGSAGSGGTSGSSGVGGAAGSQ
jgi:hypothetical protein